MVYGLFCKRVAQPAPVVGSLSDRATTGWDRGIVAGLTPGAASPTSVVCPLPGASPQPSTQTPIHATKCSSWPGPAPLPTGAAAPTAGDRDESAGHPVGRV